MLGAAGRDAVAQELRETVFEPGQVIFSRGDPGNEMHLVVRGRVRLSVLTNDGRELSFAHVEPPSIFGELAVFDGRPRSADATAVSKVVSLSLSKSAFTRLLRTLHRDPHVGQRVVPIIPDEARTFGMDALFK